MGWKFRIEQADYARRMHAVGWKDGGDKLVVVTSVTFEEHDRQTIFPQEKAFINMPWEDAKAFLQALVDGCWEAGIRPTGVEDFKRAHDVKDAHLQDMRAIVSKTVGVVLPGADG